jgi:homoserine dehydrogenase
MATIAFGARVVAGDVYHEGISNLTESDIEVARRLGYVVKLLAIAELDVSGEIAVRGAPGDGARAPPAGERVRESFNAVFVEGPPSAVDVLRRGAAGSDGECGAGRRHRRRRSTSLKGTHGTLGSFAKAPHQDRSTRHRPSTSSASRWPTEPGVLHAVTGVRPPRRQHPRRRAGGPRGRRPPRVHHPRGAGGRVQATSASCASSTSCGGRRLPARHRR